ncbi:hypothetical protein HZZ00_28965 [Streptomyces sp. NEAU-sy36]|uniref:hypothetical protein n=1 Tax=unclassified Streptomyces TaxID=2593676 RepID=UPI0015D65D0A|nr:MULTISPECIES: hypothetical protein [unclassified Streptomyces]QLJ04641.1 hypothetical protein HZZ00_28965 [Streptomyces sp. NEAU-sy36]
MRPRTRAAMLTATTLTLAPVRRCPSCPRRARLPPEHRPGRGGVAGRARRDLRRPLVYSVATDAKGDSVNAVTRRIVLAALARP